jgi:hypothetical protein
MFRETFISFAAILALGFGIAGITSVAEAKDHRVFHSRADHFAYPDYYDGYFYEDCRYRRVAVKKWNKAHTHLIKVYKKRWVCY